MEPIVWEAEPPKLRAPAMVCAFRGWNDAAGSATTALSAIADSLDGEVFAHVDPEEFFDFQVSRPTVHMVEGQAREIEWPGNNLLVARAPGAERDLVLLAGTEPNLRWRTFSEAVAEVAEQLGVEMVVTLGALLADVTHTMPTPVTGLASDEELVEELGLQRSNYEGPTGIVGVLHDACNRKGISSASLWAAVPHYVAAIPNPKAALALLRRLEGLVGVAVEASSLEDETDSFESQVSSAVEQNPEIAEMVERLQAEQAEAMGDEAEEMDLPSGDSLAKDFERYLRQQGQDPGPGGTAGS
jgi:proteasome assembly chaperone (PAC2) family protein